MNWLVFSHETFQSGYDSGREIGTSFALNRGGRGGTNFCNRSVVADDDSCHIISLISCAFVYYDKKIWNAL